MTIIGVPKEIKNLEKRVALTPAGAQQLIQLGHEIWIEDGAGEGSNFSNEMYYEVGAALVTQRDIWAKANVIIKVKEPLDNEIKLIQGEQILFTYLHLAADKVLTSKLLTRSIIAIAYETVQLPNGTLPLLTPMSEIAGRLAVQAGATSLESKNGGRGILLGGVVGVAPANVVIIGAGIAGTNACQIAKGMGARVTILDINRDRLQYVRDTFGVETLISNEENISQATHRADLVISTVLIPGAKAPKLITRKHISNMQRGSVIVDVSIDQGGSTEVSRPTTHEEPTFVVDGVTMYCVANMPGAVPMTSTLALTNATLPYIKELAEAHRNVGRPIKIKVEQLSRPLREGINVFYTQLTNTAVAEAHGMHAFPDLKRSDIL